MTFHVYSRLILIITGISNIIFGGLAALPAATSRFPTDWRGFVRPDVLSQQAGTDDKFTAGFFEGDIEGPLLEYSQTQLVEFAKNVSSDRKFQWPGGVVPTVINSAFRPQEAAKIRDVLAGVSQVTHGCVTFMERKDEVDYVEFVQGFRCSSSIGRQGGKQMIRLSKNCLDTAGHIQHEVMHALGFFHEQSRLDRDNYVWINWENIQNGELGQFQNYTDGAVFGLPYDYQSVLHYPFTAFANDSETPTILPNQKNVRIGLAQNLSDLDVLRIKKAYRCNEDSKQNEVSRGQTKKLTAVIAELIETSPAATTTITSAAGTEQPSAILVPWQVALLVVMLVFGTVLGLLGIHHIRRIYCGPRARTARNSPSISLRTVITGDEENDLVYRKQRMEDPL